MLTFPIIRNVTNKQFYVFICLIKSDIEQFQNVLRLKAKLLNRKSWK